MKEDTTEYNRNDKILEARQQIVGIEMIKKKVKIKSEIFTLLLRHSLINQRTTREKWGKIWFSLRCAALKRKIFKVFWSRALVSRKNRSLLSAVNNIYLLKLKKKSVEKLVRMKWQVTCSLKKLAVISGVVLSRRMRGNTYSFVLSHWGDQLLSLVCVSHTSLYTIAIVFKVVAGPSSLLTCHMCTRERW